MKRDRALIGLSRDHHQALVIAQGLRRADTETSGVARSAFVDFWAHGSRHFSLEEEILFPAFASHGNAYHPLIARALCDHVEIRRLAALILRDCDVDVAALQRVGVLLADHVRLEEREVFPLIEEVMPRADLAALATTLEQAESQ